MSEQSGQIYKLMGDVQRGIHAIPKNSTNAHHGYRYRGVDDLLDTVGHVFREAGVFIAHEVLTVDELTRCDKRGDYLCTRVKVRYSFTAPDGSQIQTTTIGEAQGGSDRASHIAMTDAYKVCLFQTFSIPVGGIDPEGDGDAGQQAARPPAPRQPAKPAPARPAPAGNAPAERVEYFNPDKSEDQGQVDATVEGIGIKMSKPSDRPGQPDWVVWWINTSAGQMSCANKGVVRQAEAAKGSNCTIFWKRNNKGFVEPVEFQPLGDTLPPDADPAELDFPPEWIHDTMSKVGLENDEIVVYSGITIGEIETHAKGATQYWLLNLDVGKVLITDKAIAKEFGDSRGLTGTVYCKRTAKGNLQLTRGFPSMDGDIPF